MSTFNEDLLFWLVAIIVIIGGLGFVQIIEYLLLRAQHKYDDYSRKKKQKIANNKFK